MAIYTVSITDGTTLANLAVSAGRGPKGDGFTGVTFDNTTKTFTFTSNDGLGFTSDPITIDLLADPTPQLGGNLDLNSNDITGTGDINITGGMTLTSAINGPSTFTIDPAGHGDNTGTVIIAGNLQVDGTTTTINSQTLDVADLNITVASGAADAASADGAGLTVDGANATLTYVAAGDKWVFNKPVDVTTLTATTADINGGTIDGTVIGGTTPAAISGTTITGTSFVSSGDMTFGDNDKAIFGAGSDLQIYHDGSNSYINDAGTGSLLIQANGALDINKYTGENMARFFADGAAQLYFDNALKLATTFTGIDVTGTVTADGLTVDGNPLIQGAQPYISLTDSVWTTGATLRSGVNTLGTAIGDYFLINAPSGKGVSISTNNSNNLATFAAGGDISFYEDTGTTPKFFWDASAESLGIGTTSPSQVLHLSTASTSYALAETTGTGTSAGFRMKGSASADYTLFTTQGTNQFAIYDNAAGEERMRIDSSGNLIVGKTAINTSVVGAEIRPSGFGAFVRDGGEPLFLNRLTSDGNIAVFRKDGTTVGSIGSTGGTGEVYIANNDSVGLKFTNVDAIVPSTHTGGGANRDAAIDLGYSSGGTNVRFKDLYLSGGVYLGGTGSANLLDDYEEGTWTPSVSTGAVSLTGTYIKVGKLVSIFLNGQVTTGGATSISGLPFNTAGNYGFSPYVSTQDIPSGQNSITFVTNGSTLLVRGIGDNTTYSDAPLTTGAYIHASFVFEAT